jgi:hypothetical protein
MAYNWKKMWMVGLFIVVLGALVLAIANFVPPSEQSVLLGPSPEGSNVAFGCTDSDGGLEYQTSGIAASYSDGKGLYYEDTCLLKEQGANNVWTYNKVGSCSEDNCFIGEGYCIKEPAQKIYSCANGCSDGACNLK